MKPRIHAENSVKKWGGKIADYLPIHNFFDQTKAHIPDHRHRAILHSSFGIFLCEQVFGVVIMNSDNKEVSVRDIGEQHVLEDFRGKFIPTIQDWLMKLPLEPWMDNGDGLPPSVDTPTLSTKSPKDIVFDGSKPWDHIFPTPTIIDDKPYIKPGGNLID